MFRPGGTAIPHEVPHAFRSTSGPSSPYHGSDGGTVLHGDEAAWVARAQAGDREAFARLVDRHHRLVWEVLWRICRRGGDAEDAYQEAFLAAWRSIRTFDPGRGRFGTWLHAIAARCALARNRRESRAAVGRSSLDPVAIPAEPEAVPDADAGAAVRSAIDRLPDGERETFVLRQFSGLPVRRIAEARGVSIGTVKRQLHDAVARLRGALRHLRMLVV